VEKWKEKFKYLSETKQIEQSLQEATLPQKEKDISNKLISIIKEHNKNRVNFDLDTIFEETDFNLLERYIKLRSEEKETTPNIIEEDITINEPYDKDRFYEYIFSKDDISWQKAFEEDKNLKDSYLKLKNKFINKAKKTKLYKNPAWLKIVSEHLSKEEFLEFIKTLNPLEDLV
jgi:hypothetical protein